MSYQQTLDAMKAVTDRVAPYRGVKRAGHPIDITWTVEHEYLRRPRRSAGGSAVADPIPVLATLVCASPFDAALHDAFGKAHGLTATRPTGRTSSPTTSGTTWGKEFAGLRLDRFVTTGPSRGCPCTTSSGPSIR